MCDLDHPVSCRCKNTDSWCVRKGDSLHTFPLDVLMVPSSTITVVADGEHLTCGGFSLSETPHLGNFEFITDYLDGLSRSHRRGNTGAAFMGSTHSGAPTPWRAMVEDSAEEFLTASSGEGSFSLPSPGRHDTGASLTLITTTPKKENALATQATMTVPLWMAVPWPKTYPLFE
jgi:hypothetical protein